jgi:hypothetical protein
MEAATQVQLLNFMLREVILYGLPIDSISPAAKFVNALMQRSYGFAEHAFFKDVP